MVSLKTFAKVQLLEMSPILTFPTFPLEGEGIGILPLKGEIKVGV